MKPKNERYTYEQAYEESERLRKQVDKQWAANYNEAEQNIIQLDIINAAIEELGGKQKWLRLPDNLPEYAKLANKKIVMVDDTSTLLQAYVPDLMVSTGNKTEFILHESQTPNELATAIIKSSPDIVLIDYNLAQGLRGTDVCKLLRSSGYTGTLIGFSSEKNFTSKDVDYIISKDSEPSVSLKKLAELI